MSRQIMVQKTEEVEAIKNLVLQYKSLGVANLKKVRAAQLQELKKKLKDVAHIQVIKNTLMRLALAESKDKLNLEKLGVFVSGSNIFLFTDLNPFKLAFLLEKSRVRTTAKAGDVAAIDVIVPAGNTGQPPGPIISQLNAVGLPTRIESGSVWINKDTLVVKKGETINERLASMLSQLGIKPVETGLAMTVVFDEGLIIKQDQLKIDVDGTKHDVENAYADAFALSLGISYP